MSDDDEVVDPLAAFDQMLRGMTDWARLMHSHFTAHVEAGFSPEQAFQLTRDYQRNLQVQS